MNYIDVRTMSDVLRLMSEGACPPLLKKLDCEDEVAVAESDLCFVTKFRNKTALLFNRRTGEVVFATKAQIIADYQNGLDVWVSSARSLFSYELVVIMVNRRDEELAAA